MKIYGAGLAGLIAGNMLRRHQPTIYERQTELPDNHGALLRFRTDKASRETSIPFRKVSVQKAVADGLSVTREASIAQQNSYSQKVTGKVMGRSINDLRDCERYIAPPDFIPLMSRDLNIKVGRSLDMTTIAMNHMQGIPTISTVPMPALMKIVDWPDQPKFEHNQIWSLTADIVAPEVDVYQTVYQTERGAALYRVSITGNKLIAEFINEDVSAPAYADKHPALLGIILEKCFGIRAKLANIKSKHQYYGKLLPIDEDARRSFIMAMTQEFGIYSLGRFATWRQLLIDDICDDVRVIEQFINDGNYFAAKMHSIRNKVTKH